MPEKQKEIIRYRWQHLYDNEWTKYYKNIRPLVTVCYLYTQYEDQGEFIPETYVGLSVCNIKDNPHKYLGRMQSFQRAWLYLYENTQEKIQLWNHSPKEYSAGHTLYAVSINIDKLREDSRLFYSFVVPGWTFNYWKTYKIEATDYDAE